MAGGGGGGGQNKVGDDPPLRSTQSPESRGMDRSPKRSPECSVMLYQVSLNINQGEA